MSLEQSFSRSWYSAWGWTWLLAPLLLLSVPIVHHKRKKFITQRSAVSYQSSLPIIVVGNITVGGTGKSPMVIALVDWLKQQGYSPGIVTRGHKRESDEPLLVSAISKVTEVGDEPLMLFRRTNCPVAVSAKRVQAIKALENLANVDVVVSDDGLQHYAMDRDIEIAMVDAKRGVGNGMLLPVGPLREPASRLNQVDYIFVVGDQPKLTIPQHYSHGKLRLSHLIRVGNSSCSLPLTSLADKDWTVVAGIGNPKRFMDSLVEHGLSELASSRFFADHHHYNRSDLPAKGAVIMTEKDAVKVEGFANSEDDWWCVAAELELPSELTCRLGEHLKEVITQKKIEL